MIYIFLGDDRAKQNMVDGLCSLTNDFHRYVGLTFRGLQDATHSILQDINRSHVVFIEMEENFAMDHRLDDKDHLAEWIGLFNERNIVVHVCRTLDLTDLMSAMLA